MRKLFPGYYRPKADVLAHKFKECIFCFDTNALLNLYRFTPESRENLIKVLEAIKDRVWLPHQVALEYQRNRHAVLLGELGLPGNLISTIDATIKTVDDLRRSSTLFAVNTLIQPVKADLEVIKNKLQEKKEKVPDLMTEDPVFDAVTGLFDGKVGQPFRNDRYEEIYKTGKERYDSKTPPGYMDESKNPHDVDQYGDLVLWFQLIEFAKTQPSPIIFVTDDAKEDWWKEVRGQKLGPRPELVQEFMVETGGEKWFYMYSTEQFLKYAKEYLDAKVTPEAIKEAEGIEKQDAAQEKYRMEIGLEAAEAIVNAWKPGEDWRKALAIQDETRRTLADFALSSEEARKRLAATLAMPDAGYVRLADLALSTEEARKRLAATLAMPDASNRTLADLAASADERYRTLADLAASADERYRTLASLAVPDGRYKTLADFALSSEESHKVALGSRTSPNKTEEAVKEKKTTEQKKRNP